VDFIALGGGGISNTILLQINFAYVSNERYIGFSALEVNCECDSV